MSWWKVDRGKVLIGTAILWLLIIFFWLSTRGPARYDHAHEGTIEEEEDLSLVTFPLSLKGMYNVNRACRSLLTLTYRSIQVLHKVKEALTINVVTSADQKYLPGLIALINSTIIHTKNSVSFYVVTDSGQDEFAHLQTLLHSLFPEGRFPKQKVTFKVVGFDPSHVAKLIKTYPGEMTDPKVHANPHNYARFYFHELFPELSKAVYLDPDTIMLGNVAELGTVLDHQDEFLYAVAQGLPHTYAQAFEWSAPIVQQSFDKNEPYFNAGVAVLNFDEWRRRNITAVVERWMAMHKERKLWAWGTQPPLMAAFYRHYHLLDSSWNVRHFGVPGLVPPTVELVRAKLLHWNGGNKPWQPACRKDSTCFRSCWEPFYGQDRIRNLLTRSSSLSSTFSTLINVL